jgi:hypothetical protein
VVARFDQDTPVFDVSHLEKGMYRLVGGSNASIGFNWMFLKTE